MIIINMIIITTSVPVMYALLACNSRRSSLDGSCPRDVEVTC